MTEINRCATIIRNVGMKSWSDPTLQPEMPFTGTPETTFPIFDPASWTEVTVKIAFWFCPSCHLLGTNSLLSRANHLLEYERFFKNYPCRVDPLRQSMRMIFFMSFFFIYWLFCQRERATKPNCVLISPNVFPKWTSCQGTRSLSFFLSLSLSFYFHYHFSFDISLSLFQVDHHCCLPNDEVDSESSNIS